MVLYNILFFDRNGRCLFKHQWTQGSKVQDGNESTVEDEHKNVFGLFFSLKRLATSLDPSSANKPKLLSVLKIGEGCNFHSFTTNVYKFHYLESPAGIKIVLNTSPEVGDLQEVMGYIYSSIYVEYVIKNPLHELGDPFSQSLFADVLTKYLRSVNLAT